MNMTPEEFLNAAVHEVSTRVGAPADAAKVQTLVDGGGLYWNGSTWVYEQGFALLSTFPKLVDVATLQQGQLAALPMARAELGRRMRETLESDPRVTGFMYAGAGDSSPPRGFSALDLAQISAFADHASEREALKQRIVEVHLPDSQKAAELRSNITNIQRNALPSGGNPFGDPEAA
jgi:hypothetical protein